MLEVGVEREGFLETGDAQKFWHMPLILFHKAADPSPHSSASWARNVPRPHSLNGLRFTTTSLLLELVT
jgi:hypothetical protein